MVNVEQRGERSDGEAGSGGGGEKTTEMNFVKSNNCRSWIEHVTQS